MQLLNQDALIQRHSDVATVWLLSTLGIKSNYRKITKKQIQDISIPDTVTVITEPENMDNIQNLRVSSNLLYGVAIVYKQKLNYLESDTVNVKSKLARDLLRVLNPSSNNHLIQVPRDIIVNGGPYQAAKSLSKSKETRSVFLQEDPLFSIDDDLLPPLDFLTQQPVDVNSNRERIKRFDLQNNTVASLTTNEDEDGIFTNNRLNEDEEDQLNEVEFAFDDDGFLLDLQTNSTGDKQLKQSSEVGTPQPEIEDRFDDFDFTFGGQDQDEALDRVPLPEGAITPQRESTPLGSASGKVSTPSALNDIQEEHTEMLDHFPDFDVEMDQIFDEIPAVDELNDPQEGDVPTKTKKPIAVKNKRSAFSLIKIDEQRVSLNTDELREFRDKYIENQISRRPCKKRDLGLRLKGYLEQQVFFLPELAFKIPTSNGNQLDRDMDHVMYDDDVEVARDAQPDINKNDDDQFGMDAPDIDFVDDLMISNEVTEVEVARRSSRRHSSRSSLGSRSNNNLNEGNNFDDNFNFSAGGYQDFDYAGEVFEVVGDKVGSGDDTIHEAGDSSGSGRIRRSSSSIGARPIATVVEGDEFDIPVGTQYHTQTGGQEGEADEKLLMNSKAEKFYKFLLSKVPEDQNSIVFSNIFNGVYHKETVVKSFYEVLQLNNLNKLKIRVLTTSTSEQDKFKVLTGKDFEILI